MAGIPGVGGQNRLPTNVKRIRGTLRSDRVNPREPQLAAGRPRRPKWLSKDAREHWRRLCEDAERLGVLTPVDGDALALLAETIAQFIRYRDTDWRAASTFSKFALRLLMEFGLTPSSRGRVHVAVPAAEPDEFEELMARRREHRPNWDGPLS
jgi:phage terminase small subunit